MSVAVNGIAHIQLTVTDPERCIPFWESFLHFLDMKTLIRNDDIVYCIGSRTGVLVRGAPPDKRDVAFDQNRPGLDSQWHHFVGIGSDVNEHCKLYIDGVLKDTTFGLEAGHWDADDGEDIYIGADENNNYDFTGYIDDIMFFVNEELSQSQVTALKGYSFGDGATEIDFLIGNYTDSIG